MLGNTTLANHFAIVGFVFAELTELFTLSLSLSLSLSLVFY
ncbi:MAG: hypothetical protein MRECE_45c018 [Mycoplasmataceae bacterium CE_OT135]|nr:MAG: hypothetical protein MRECE_45c018 [Mycoplasmataceae bacterium CE_OT135]